MYAPLIQLEEINAKCRIQLAKILSSRYQLGIIPNEGKTVEKNSRRGIAYFRAFDPWNTCWRFPADSFRYFNLAERQGLIGSHEATALTSGLIQHAAETAKLYDGGFSFFFDESPVRTILGHADELNHLLESGLAVGGAWADRLCEMCPWPTLPNLQLELLSFRPLATAGVLEFSLATPWLAWIEALDLTCIGSWMGFTPDQIQKIVGTIRSTTRSSDILKIQLEENFFGQKVIIPFFSGGLQGMVFGCFHDIPKPQREPIITTLKQFGQTVADAYSMLRIKHFTHAIEGQLDDEALAREFIQAVSPVQKLILRREGRRFGYRLGHEHIYWSGYYPMTQQEISVEASTFGFTVTGPAGSEIYIEPISDVPNFDPSFMRMRLENCLNPVLGATTTCASDGATLSFADVRKLRVEFEGQAADERASVAKLRQYYVVQKIEKYWHSGTVKVTNSEMKSYLEGRGRDAKNGYQVTSFASDFEKIFAGKITVAKTRNALSLVWSKTASADASKSRNT